MIRGHSIHRAASDQRPVLDLIGEGRPSVGCRAGLEPQRATSGLEATC